MDGANGPRDPESGVGDGSRCVVREFPRGPDRRGAFDRVGIRGGTTVITIRHMKASELERIAEIDRSEHVNRVYSYRNGSLETRIVDIAVPPWSRSGGHEHSVPNKLDAWRPILDRGGTLVGAFDGEVFAGFAVHQPRLDESTANLSALFVSANERRRGIGSLLVEEIVRLARADGARRLYVSATPSVATVEFYRSQGFDPTDEPNPALLAREPDDIHMTREL